MLHNNCGREFEIAPKEFTRGRRCAYCFGKKRKTTSKFAHEVTQLTDGDYMLIDNYVNNKTDVCIQHISCGNVYKVTPKDFLSGNRCPKCKQSKGEKLVSDILDNLSIPYEIQKGFGDLKRNGVMLRYDFYIPEVNLLIEYDGIQHFVPVKYFGGESKLESQKLRDQRKNIYAQDNNISLLRVNYTMTPSTVERHVINTINKCKAETLSDRV